MKVMTIFGTRPEGIKMAPLIHALQNEDSIECIIVNTAQHREMLDQVLQLFNIAPHYDLDLMKEEQSPENITSSILTHLSHILADEKPDLVLVHGDTATTFAGAFSAFLKQIPVGHVEAGLRTYDIYSPFPEEINRQLVSRIASIHFAATIKNKEQLINEQINHGNVSVVGNTVIDALLHVANKPFQFPPELHHFLTNKNRTILLTTHRRENLENMKDIFQAVNQIIETNSDVQVLFPIHKNPTVRKKAASFLIKDERVLVTEPLDYETFVHTMKASHLIITDSGGIQEEAPALGKPVLVTRNTTERTEGVEAGTLILVGTSAEKIVKETQELLDNEKHYIAMTSIQNPYGDGNTSAQIVSIIKNYFE